MFKLFRPTSRLCHPSGLRRLGVVLFWVATGPLHAALDAPVSPNAIPAVGTLLNFLDSTRGNYIVSGQQEIAWSQPRKDEDFNYIVASTGKTPAVRGFDFLQHVYSPSVRAQQDATERAITWAHNGGIVTFCCHMFMNIGSTNGQPQFYTPGSNGNPDGTNFDIRQAVINGTPENIEYLAKLDIIAAELTKLRDAGVPVIWRPFHECGGTWFWWSRYGAAPFIQAYQLMFNRFTQMHGLTNLIWVFNPIDSTTTMQNWYPGDSYVDMIALDTYPAAGTHPTFAPESTQMRNFKNGRKVIAMSECGSIPDPDQLFSQGAVWSYFCTWNGFENDLSRHTVTYLNTVYNHPKVITLENLPTFYVPFPLTSAPAFTFQPASTTVSPGASVIFSVAASGTPAPTFQWQKNGVNINGATNNTYSILIVAAGDAGDYTAIATNSAGSATSNIARLTVFSAAACDFDGDGRSDVLLSNTVTGDRAIWFMNGTTIATNAFAGTVPVAWTVSGTGDFNGDGKADLFWTNTLTGDRAVWLMNGSTNSGGGYLGTVPVEWTVSGTGDFNGDGKTDVLWTNTATGERAMWLMNGSVASTGASLGVVPVAWVINGTGDFNGDGKADVLLSNTVTGDRAIWFMNGTAVATNAFAGTVPVEWTVSGTGDFNGDGKADLFWTNTLTGDRAVWLMNGSTNSGGGYLGAVPVEWTVSGTGDFNGDGKADVLWTNTATGERAMWLMNGSVASTGASLGVVPVQWAMRN